MNFLQASIIPLLVLSATSCLDSPTPVSLAQTRADKLQEIADILDQSVTSSRPISCTSSDSTYQLKQLTINNLDHPTELLEYSVVEWKVVLEKRSLGTTLTLEIDPDHQHIDFWVDGKALAYNLESPAIANQDIPRYTTAEKWSASQQNALSLYHQFRHCLHNSSSPELTLSSL